LTCNGAINITNSDPRFAVALTPGTLKIFSVSPPNLIDTFNLCELQSTGILKIGENGDRTGDITIATGINHQLSQKIIIGTTLASNQTITFNRPIRINATESPAVGDNVLLFNNQTTGSLSIGGSTTRTGAINIGTGCTGNAPINIGSATSGTQTITFNRPITMSGTNGITCSGAGKIETIGILQSRGLTIQDSSSNNMATINTSGAISCNTMTATDLIKTTNNMSAQKLVIRDVYDTNDVTTISGGNISTKISVSIPYGGVNVCSMDWDGYVSCARLRSALSPGYSDARVLPLYIGDNQTIGVLQIGHSDFRTGAIYIATGCTGNAPIILGSLASTTQTITVNRPITIGYLSNPTSNMQIGGSIFSTASNVSITSSGTRNITTLEASSGVFMVSYCLRHTIASSTVAFTNTNVVISNANNNMTPLNGIQTIENANISRSTGTDVYMTTGSGVLILTSVSNISLNVNYTFTGGTISISGDLRLVRIG
jgi:hypothetical protein